MIESLTNPAVSITFALVCLSGILFGRSTVLFATLRGKTSGIVPAIIGEAVAAAVLLLGLFIGNLIGLPLDDMIQPLFLVWLVGAITGGLVFFVLRVAFRRP